MNLVVFVNSLLWHKAEIIPTINLEKFSTHATLIVQHILVVVSDADFLPIQILTVVVGMYFPWTV